MRKPYYVYGGLQDNGSWGGPSQTRNQQAGITNADWFRIGGGDGFYTQIDPTDYNTIYVESQGGNMQRLDLRTGRSVSIRPRGVPRRGGQGRQAGATPAASPSPEASPVASPASDTQAQLAAFAQAQGFGGGAGNLASNVVPTPPPTETYRFYWSTPIHLSPHNPRVVYAGGNRLFRSMDRGDTWTTTIDLSKQIDRNTLPIMGVPGNQPMASKHDGYNGYGYVVSVAESPKVPGILWVGTDDGNVQVTTDGGKNWNNLVKNVNGVAANSPVSHVEPSRTNASTAYISFDRHMFDDFKPYIFKTTDGGKS